jgi:hypothetical protein
MSAPPDDTHGFAGIHAEARRGWLKAVAALGGRLREGVRLCQRGCDALVAPDA